MEPSTDSSAVTHYGTGNKDNRVCALLTPPQMIEMHFKNVDLWACALYKKIFNMFKLLKD